MKCTNKILSITGFLLFTFINTINAQGACLTPSEQIGQCILLRSCTALYNIILQSGGQLTPEQRKLISNSWCGTDENNQHKVCCPQMTQPTITTQANPEVTLTPTDYSSHPNSPLFDLRTCGNVPQDRIFLGNKTEPFQYPWMAIIQYKNLNNDIEQNCGGSIITLRFILTAAHCITLLRGDIALHSVVVGEHNTKTEIDCINGDCAPPIQTILIDIAIPHPAYDKRRFTNDIGVLRLQSLIEKNDGVRRICLPMTIEMQTLNLQSVIVTGWGKTENSSASDELLQALVPTVPVDECNRRYNARYRGRITISAIHLCAGGDQSDSCQGDSGGPAIYLAGSSFGPRSVQYGIVSAGASQCGVNYGIPGLYARVTPYMKWILDTCNE